MIDSSGRDSNGANDGANDVWVGIDVGGTFTDAVLFDQADGRLQRVKTPSTPGAPERAVLDALSAFGKAAGARLARIVHGITIGTNAVIERSGAEVWVITTRGFRDTLEIARTERRTLYDIKTLKPAPLVPRARILEIDERVAHDGSVLVPLDGASVDAAVRTLAANGADAVAVCLLHSYAQPAHERAVAAAVRTALPHAFVCTSGDVLPELREYERFSTTVLNAYIGPLMGRYLDALAAELAARARPVPLFLMTSNGGVVGARRAAALAVQTVLSGPAGGVAAACALGRQLGRPQLITCDMGGTSTDVCLVDGLDPPLTSDRQVGGLPVRTPQLDIETVGAGGGSIAWLDAGDMLCVGPRSAGAEPGPAAYGRGGTDATVTDANLCLGRFHAASTLAGSLTLDAGLARTAVAALAARLHIGTEPLAEGIVRIAVARMVSAIKEISITRGHDPRDFTLLAYGGAGPMHAAFIAEELEIARVLVPVGPGNFSAFGCLVSDLKQTLVRSVRLDLRNADWAELQRELDALDTDARAALGADGLAPDGLAVDFALGMRYVGQSWDLVVPLPPGHGDFGLAGEAFRAAHAQRFGHAGSGPVEIVSARATVTGTVHGPRDQGPSDAAPTGPASRDVWFDGKWCTTNVLGRDGVGSVPIAGPALIEEMGALTVVPPGWAVRRTDGGVLEMNCR